MRFDISVMKNWRWWMALPYMLAFVTISGSIALIGIALEWVGKKMQLAWTTNKNVLFANQVVGFVKRKKRSVEQQNISTTVHIRTDPPKDPGEIWCERFLMFCLWALISCVLLMIQ